ncbi:hypothetical protein KY290_035837 [Solanum tuberosum]|uniref:Uncharacterized protein n=1 Tax=Solanum tuberosum TaxID=4113 RepID=A0ABQ7TSL4_SOLTU|nr:hypothetical protein KY284_035200 [Solanum tuberosum]KAH0737132.1 hypothetical protein KY290_035837 [Solanum tuberosum]
MHPFDDVVRGCFDDVLSIMIKGKVFLNFQLIDVSDDMIYLPDMTRGRGRGNTTRASKTLIRGRGSTSRVNMLTVPFPITNSHQGGINSSAGPDQNNQFQTLAPTSSSPVQTSAQGSTPSVNFETPPIISNQSNAIGESASTQRNVIREATTSSQNNTISEGESHTNSGQQTLVFISHFGLEPSNICSTRICESFKSELDPNGINWKRVSQEIKVFYLGEFKKQFYWDPSIDSEVKILWRKKAARRYSDFISCIKKEAIRPKYVPEETWESWMRFWKDPKVIEKSKINSKNRCGDQNVVAKGTHTGGSITIGEHRKRLAVEKGRDPTPSELHLHVHTHGHDGKSFVGERARNVHEKYLEILQNQTQTQSDVDQLQAYYQAAGGEKKRRIYGFGAQDKSFYGTNLCASASGTDASSSIPCTNAQTIATENLDDFMTRLIPSLIDKMLPILFEHVHGLISSTSSQPNTHMTPVTSTPANVDDAYASVSNED